MLNSCSLPENVTVLFVNVQDRALGNPVYKVLLVNWTYFDILFQFRSLICYGLKWVSIFLSWDSQSPGLFQPPFMNILRLLVCSLQNNTFSQQWAVPSFMARDVMCMWRCCQQMVCFMNCPRDTPIVWLATDQSCQWTLNFVITL